MHGEVAAAVVAPLSCVRLGPLCMKAQQSSQMRARAAILLWLSLLVLRQRQIQPLSSQQSPLQLQPLDERGSPPVRVHNLPSSQCALRTNAAVAQ